MPDLDLDAIRRAMEAASPGPWVAEGRYVTDSTDCVYVCEVGNIGNPCVRRDRDLIVLLRNSAPALLAEIERLRRIEAAARDVLNHGPHMTCEEMHHRPGDEHGSLEPCPAVDRFRLAKDRLRAALGGK